MRDSNQPCCSVQGQAHQDKCAKAAQKCSVCVECGSSAPRSAARALGQHPRSAGHQDRVAWLQYYGSATAAAAAGSAPAAASPSAAGSSSDALQSAAAAASSQPGGGQPAASSTAAAAAEAKAPKPALPVSVARAAQTAASEAGLGCVVCKLKGRQPPAHFKVTACCCQG